MAHTYNDVLRVTKNILDGYQTTGAPSPDIVEETVLAGIATAFKLENAMRDKGEKWPIPQTLPPVVVAQIMARLYPIYTVCTGDESNERQYDLLAIYQTEGKHKGIYSTDEDDFRALAYKYCYTLQDRAFKELLIYLRTMVPRIVPTRASNLIAVNNGVFDYDTKQLMPFDPKYVFLSKSSVDYVPGSKNVVIHNPNDNTDWDVESWIKELSDDSEVCELLWQLIGAVIRPNVPWNKFACFYSETGNNGKGTFCELLRAICGDGNCVSIPIAELGKEFALEPLVRSSAIIVDENDVGTFVDKAANLKAIVTGDVVRINRKFKSIVPFRFRGFMVQCLNEMPRVKDRSDSFYRRQLFIPFEKTFTGVERKYIKNDYLRRPEVLQYVLYKVLHDTNYYNLSEPEACLRALDEYKQFNDPIRQFADEILHKARWELLPWSFLYDLYKAWLPANVPGGGQVAKQKFKKDLWGIVQKEYPEWTGTNPNDLVWSKGRMTEPEPLIDKYNLTDWMNPTYAAKGSMNSKARCTFPTIFQSTSYRGLLRVAGTSAPDPEDDYDD